MDTVGPKRAGKQFPTTPTADPRAKRHFRAANGSVIHSHGEITIMGEADEGQRLKMIMTVAVVSNVPTKEETEESNALIWVAVLLVLGTLVPMATWWVFSR